MNRAPSPHPSPPVGEGVPEGRVRENADGSGEPSAALRGPWNLSLDGGGGVRHAGALEALAGGRLAEVRLLGIIRHSITQHRIRLEVFRARLASGHAPNREGKWLKLEELRRLPLPSAHARIRRWLGSQPPGALRPKAV